MDKLLVQVDKEAFERLVESHGGTRQALDFLSLKIDQMVRQRRRAERKKETVALEIPLRPNLLPIFDRYCREFNLTRETVINRIVRKEKNPKK